jgi:hypothetical protein
MTLTIQDSKPLVEFLVKLDRVISQFEKVPVSNVSSENALSIPLLFPQNLDYTYPKIETPELCPIYNIKSEIGGEKNCLVMKL